MKVKEMIDILNTLNPDERIMVAWWSKDTVQGWTDKPITDEMWVGLVDTFDDWDLQEVADDIETLIEVRDDDEVDA
jgi:hypothetical protein